MKRWILVLLFSSLFLPADPVQRACEDMIIQLNRDLSKVEKSRNDQSTSLDEKMNREIAQIHEQCRFADIQEDFERDGEEFLGLKNILKKLGSKVRRQNLPQSSPAQPSQLDQLEQNCRKGKVSDCYAAGKIYLDLAPAISYYYRKACRGGIAKACYDLARLEEGKLRACSVNLTSARIDYLLACEEGMSKACEEARRLGSLKPHKRAQASKPKPQSYVLSGHYRNEMGEVDISPNGKVSVEVATIRCTGQLKGVANSIQGNRMVVVPSPIDPDAPECRLILDFNADGVTVKESGCSYFHGAYCDFDGKYYR